jgi:hypothetical protein
MRRDPPDREHALTPHRCKHPGVRVALPLLVTLGLAAGCAHRVTPRLSHAHLGHALTAWHDTPGQQGLLVVARQRADTALGEAQKATQANGEAARKHLANVAAALAPEVGNERAYGLVRALEGAIEHIEYAAAAKDASRNVVTAGDGIGAVADSVIDGYRRALTVASSADKLPAEQLRQTALELQRGLLQLSNGSDADGDGRITLAPREAGLAQIEQRLAQAVAEERDPPFRPLPHSVLFGLVRTADGQWGFGAPRPEVAAPPTDILCSDGKRPAAAPSYNAAALNAYGPEQRREENR